MGIFCSALFVKLSVTWENGCTMDEEKIFGPLTLRQFLYVAGGVVLIYFSMGVLEEKFFIPLDIFIAIAVFVAVKNAPVVIVDENYINRKKYSCNPEEFKKWLNRKIAMVQAQISIREAKGMKSDPELERMLGIYEKAMEGVANA